MKIFIIRFCTAWLLIAGVASGDAQSTAQAEKLLESARHKEVMEGDLKAAIEQYRKIAAQFAKQPDIAARALFQLGQCQEKLGQAEARKSYERIVREYGGAEQYASAARARLAALGGEAPAGQQAARLVRTTSHIDSGLSSLSPDGRFMTFPDYPSGTLALRDLVTGTERHLTKDGSWKAGETVYAEASAISKDGSQVAYAWYEEKRKTFELRLLGLAGNSTPRSLFFNADVDRIEPRAWSPDGKWIAAELNAKGQSQIGLIGAEDGSLHVLKSARERLEVRGASADGKSLVYTLAKPEVGVVATRSYILSTDGKTDVPVLPGSSSSLCPVWTPDGSRIVFTSDRSGAPELWAVHVQDGKPIGEPELLKADASNVCSIGFARDGSLFYAVELVQNNIYIARLDPATGKLISEPERVNQRIGNSTGPIAWLPDGKSVSFWNQKPNRALVIHSLDSGEEREILAGKTGQIAFDYGWFPDGSLMSRKAGQSQVFSRMDSHTGETSRSWSIPTPPPDTYSYLQSPDLMTHYFTRKDDSVPCEAGICFHVVSAHDLETGKDRDVFRLKTTALRFSASVSRDGRTIAFPAQDEHGAYRVMVVASSGGEPREIYRYAENFFIDGTAWTRDGAHVLAFRPDGEIWSIPVKGGAAEKVSVPFRRFSSPVVSPEGTQLAFLGRQFESKIWVMTGLFPAAKPAATH